MSEQLTLPLVGQAIEKDIRELMVGMAELTSEVKELRHDVRGFRATMDTYAPRREIEMYQKTTDARLDSLESDRKWLIRSIFTLILAGLASVMVGAGSIIWLVSTFIK